MVFRRDAGYGEAHGLRYLLSDHLGSTSITTDTNGVKTSELRYKPFGEERSSSGTMPPPTSTPTPQQPTSTPTSTANGIVREAESGTLANMSSGSAGSCGYISGGDWGAGYADYTFTISNTGAYTMHWIVSNPYSSVGVGSFYYKFDGGSTFQGYYQVGDTGWGWATLPSITLGAGTHTLRIYGGRPNSRLDLIEINQSSAPSYSGSACLAGMQQVESVQSLEGSQAEFSQAAVVNEETTTAGGYTKYYYVGGDLVAFNRSSGYGQDYGRRYVFKDHPSTSLRT
ncbi:MAG: hypothetical protein GY743_22330, partial [Planctomycetaceae bacterium]|nr:hypothetical protein [Planctomycetaceae bacterium]